MAHSLRNIMYPPPFSFEVSSNGVPRYMKGDVGIDLCTSAYLSEVFVYFGVSRLNSLSLQFGTRHIVPLEYGKYIFPLPLVLRHDVPRRSCNEYRVIPIHFAHDPCKTPLPCLFVYVLPLHKGDVGETHTEQVECAHEVVTGKGWPLPFSEGERLQGFKLPWFQVLLFARLCGKVDLKKGILFLWKSPLLDSSVQDGPDPREVFGCGVYIIVVLLFKVGSVLPDELGRDIIKRQIGTVFFQLVDDDGHPLPCGNLVFCVVSFYKIPGVLDKALAFAVFRYSIKHKPLKALGCGRLAISSKFEAYICTCFVYPCKPARHNIMMPVGPANGIGVFIPMPGVYLYAYRYECTLASVGYAKIDHALSLCIGLICAEVFFKCCHLSKKFATESATVENKNAPNGKERGISGIFGWSGRYHHYPSILFSAAPCHVIKALQRDMIAKRKSGHKKVQLFLQLRYAPLPFTASRRKTRLTMQKIFVVIEKSAKGIDSFHGAFSTRSKAKRYLVEIASDQSEYEVREIEVDENAVIQNPIFTI